MAGEIVHGMRELMAGFGNFPEKLQRKAMTKVMRAGGRPIVLAARGKVARVSGALARSIRVTVVRRRGVVIARIIAGRILSRAEIWDADAEEYQNVSGIVWADDGSELMIETDEL